MGVRIKIAATAEELDQLFQVRHRVFVAEKRYFPPVDDGRLLDRFDAFPTTANIVAIYEEQVVGGVRICEPSGCGVPADEFFDFRPYLPEGALVGSGSMLVMEEGFRQVPRVTFAMLGMMYYWALCKGLTHITGVAAPEAVKLFLGSGYKPVAEPVVHGPSQLPALPVVLDIVELNDRFSAFVDKQQFRHFLQSFERQFHQKGEHIIRRGEAGTAAYVIIEGRVGVSVGGGARRSAVPPPSPEPGRPAIPPPPRMPSPPPAAPPREIPKTPPTGSRLDLGAPPPRSPPPRSPPPRSPPPVDEGPVSVRNPGRMSDRGGMVQGPPSERVLQSNEVPTRLRPDVRVNDLPASLRAPFVTMGETPQSQRGLRPQTPAPARPVTDVPISTHEARLTPVPISSRSSSPPSSRVSSPPSVRSSVPLSVREMGPGEVFGELALITAQPRSADVIALTDVDLMVLERETFHRQVSQNPDVALSLLSVIGNRLMSVTDRLSEVTEEPE